MLAIFEIFGLRFFFYSDEHRPVHAYAIKGDDDTRIQMEDEVRSIHNHGLRAKDLKRTLEPAGMYKEDIINVWNGYH